MSIDRGTVEAEIIARLKGFMDAVNMDTSTTNGTNADLARPIAWAIRQSGGTVETAGAPTDDEVAAIDEDQLYDLAEYQTLRTIYQRYTAVDGSAGAVSGKLDQLRQAMKERLAELATTLAALYGVLVTTNETGRTASVGTMTAGTESPWLVR